VPSSTIDLQNLVSLLALRLTNFGEAAVFLLGAGCSMQYGLPSFHQLLTYLGSDLRLPRFSQSEKLEHVRLEVETRWSRATNADYRRTMIARYLNRMSGAECPAYRQLARLAKAGHVRAFINMNFDTLLEQALAAEGVSFKTTNSISRSQPGELYVYKLHGSVGALDIPKGEEDVILDLAKSDLFTESERSAARSLLQSSDVVIVGYSGIDLKLPGALMPPSKKKEGKKVFLVNLTEPDVRLLHAAKLRDPEYLMATGNSASFENFMEQLSLEMYDRDRTATPRPNLSRLQEFDLMTWSESNAFNRCLQAAISIRAGMNVADTSTIGILEHAHEVFRICSELARASGICLTSPEKHLLRCASVVHDLGYFLAFCGGRATENPGWLLMSRHGRLTIDVLKERFAEDPSLASGMIPESYDATCKNTLVEYLLAICRYHNSLRLPSRAVSEDTCEVKVHGVPVITRFRLLQSLFAAAENIAQEHPFLPSSGPIATEGGSRWAIEDPFLDLYLRRKKGSVRFTIEHKEVTAEIAVDSARSHATTWLLAMTSEFVGVLDRTIRHGEYGWGISLKVPATETIPKIPGNQQAFLKGLLVSALEEALGETVRTIKGQSAEEAASLLDLVMIYTKCYRRREPRVSLNSDVVTSALQRMDERGRKPHRGVLHLYLETRRKSRRSPMEQVFLHSFDRLLYPGWRFLARNWSDGIEGTLTARASLDLGSSRFRNEVTHGLKHLLREKVTWRGKQAFGHDGCTLCTARLLYIFTSARQLFPAAEFERVAINRRGHTLNDAVRGMLVHFQMRNPDDPAWSGVTAEESQEERIDSPDYASWAAWALAYCLEVDAEIRFSGESWLSESCGFPASEVVLLAQERWRRLVAVTARQLLGPRVEEPHSFTVGQFASSFLNTHRLTQELRSTLMPSSAGLQSIAAEIENVYSQLTHRPLSQLGLFYLWPAAMFLDSLAPGQKEEALILTCYECLKSPLWIKQGPDTGSWGFNVKNTSTILTTLASFWRYVFEGDEGRNRERFEEAFSRYPRELRSVLSI
jgi:hypothetical protein